MEQNSIVRMTWSDLWHSNKSVSPLRYGGPARTLPTRRWLVAVEQTSIGRRQSTLEAQAGGVGETNERVSMGGVEAMATADGVEHLDVDVDANAERTPAFVTGSPQGADGSAFSASGAGP